MSAQPGLLAQLAEQGLPCLSPASTPPPGVTQNDDPSATLPAQEENPFALVDDERPHRAAPVGLLVDPGPQRAEPAKPFAHGTAAFAGEVDGRTKSRSLPARRSCRPCSGRSRKAPR